MPAVGQRRRSVPRVRRVASSSSREQGCRWAGRSPIPTTAEVGVGLPRPPGDAGVLERRIDVGPRRGREVVDVIGEHGEPRSCHGARPLARLRRGGPASGIAPLLAGSRGGSCAARRCRSRGACAPRPRPRRGLVAPRLVRLRSSPRRAHDPPCSPHPLPRDTTQPGIASSIATASVSAGDSIRAARSGCPTGIPRGRGSRSGSPRPAPPPTTSSRRRPRARARRPGELDPRQRRRSGAPAAARKPRGAQPGLGPLDRVSTPIVTGVPYGTRDARQAAAGLSHVRRPSARDHVAHVGLGEAGVDEREHRAPLGGRPLAGPVVAEVVDVHAEHDGGAGSAAASGPTTSISAVLQWKQRSPSLADVGAGRPARR